MRNAAFIVLVAVSACSSATADPGATRAPTQERVRLTSDTAPIVLDINVTRPDFVGGSVVPVGRASLWPHLVPVYDRLGLPAPVVDADAWAVAVSDHALIRRLGDMRLSTYVGCGTDITGQIADTHRIRLSLRTWLEPAGGENTAVRSRLEATASPQDGRTGSFTCASTGRLEQRIAEQLHERAQADPH